MRVFIAGELGKILPPLAQHLITYLDAQADSKGLIKLNFSVGGLPRSLNKMYERGVSFCKVGTPGAFQDKQGRWRVQNNRLRPDVIRWRETVAEAMGDLRFRWTPTGASAAILLFESPYWLDGRRGIRAKDVDNVIKPVLDAVQHATGAPDEAHWSVHGFKVLSKRQRTTIFLYDLGTVVEYFY